MNKKDDKAKNVHAGHRNRMWERYQISGFDTFQPHEVLEMLLYQLYPRCDTNERAHKLIERFGSLENVVNADVDDLIAAGLTPRGASIFTLYRTVHNYIKLSGAKKDLIVLENIYITGEYCCKHFGYDVVESLHMIVVDPKMKIKHVSTISTGNDKSTQVNAENIMRTALNLRAAGVILCHNHPGGNVTPSNADIESTNAIASLLGSVNVPLIDHIICSQDKYESFAGRGYLKN